MRARSWLGPLVLSIAVLACTSSRDPAPGSTSPAWPELPRTPEAADALIRACTARPLTGGGADTTSSEGLLRAIDDRPAALVAGAPGVVAWIQGFLDRAAAAGHDSAVLFGTYHDSGGQIEAFRRLIGPLGLRGLTHVAVEQLRADGAWRGVPADAQRGDDAAIGAWLARGDRGALSALAQRHAASDYAAWKFGYEASVLDLLVTARAAAVPLAGCDLPSSAQALLTGLPELARLRLRELHCLLSLGAAKGPRRMALLWGQAHVRREGLRRFLPPETAALSVYAIGYREGEWTTEATLGGRLALTDPLLIPLDPEGTEVAVLYPDGPLAANVDRVRAEASTGTPGLRVHVVGATGTLHIGDRAFPVGPDVQEIAVPAGEQAYVLAVDEVRFAGALHLPPGGGLDLTFDPAHRAVAWTERPPPAGSP
ncbi:MAG: hypothetical protein ABJE95_14060 [Byssovorax sp.]